MKREQKYSRLAESTVQLTPAAAAWFVVGTMIFIVGAMYLATLLSALIAAL